MKAQRTAKSVSCTKGTTVSVRRSSKNQSVKSKYPETRRECRRWFGLLPTDQQIRYYASQHSPLKRDVAEDIFDTYDRDYFIAFVVADVLGEKYHWPLNGDTADYKEHFYSRFYAKAIEKGIKVTAAARRLALPVLGGKMYDQLIVMVPEKLFKRFSKALKKKFDIHSIEGGEIISAEGTTVQCLANGVNSTLMTIVQIWAEGYIEGASE
jgi:hypothetical protein